jgi:heat shock protein 1/8
MEGDTPVVVPNSLGHLTTPSVVNLGDDVSVGVKAKRMAAVDPLNTYYSVKRLIGKCMDDASDDVKLMAFQTDQDDDGLVLLHSSRQEEGIYPEEISALVLRQLLEDASAFKGGEEITKAVISVPAYFNDEQKEATVAAGMMAGLKKVRLLREPVAAALAYGIRAEKDQTVLVFDLGGGTFDVSLLEVGGGVIEVLSTGGDPHLGGDDWDQVIIDWLKQQYLKPAGVDTDDPQMIANLKAVAEAAKMQLSKSDTAVIRMPVAGGIEAFLNRQKFESLAEDLFRRARLPLDMACWQAGVDLGTALKEWETAQTALRKRDGGQRRAKKAVQDQGVQITPKKRMPVSEVLLVGGATRMPAVRKFVENMTGLVPKETNVDPDLAVALGAAVQAGIYEGNVSDVMIMDIWQASLMRAYATQLEKEQEQDANLVDD